MGCCCVKPLAFVTRSVVVTGSRGSGVSTVARRLADATNPARRNAACEEEWSPVPLPCTGSVDEWPPTRRHGPQIKFVDVGAFALLHDAERANSAFDRCSAVVMVLDATRSFDAQGAASVLKAIDATAARDKPLVILLNKYDLTRTPALSRASIDAKLQLSKRSSKWCCLPSVATHRFAHLDPLVTYCIATNNSKAPVGPLVELPSPASTLNVPPSASPLRSAPPPDARASRSSDINTTPRVGGYVQYDDIDPVRKPVQPTYAAGTSRSAVSLRSADVRSSTPLRDTELLPRTSSTIDAVTKPKGYVRLART